MRDPSRTSVAAVGDSDSNARLDPENEQATERRPFVHCVDPGDLLLLHQAMALSNLSMMIL